MNEGLQATQTNGGMAMTPDRIALIKRTIAKDATEWKFFFHAKHEGGVNMTIGTLSEIDPAMSIIRQAHDLVNY